METKEPVEFGLTYSALKMFGKQLYSNATSAIAELVANGLDAQASKVKIFIDARNKEKAIVEIFDNGKGMSPEDIKSRYILIGYNKRKSETDLPKSKTMGRKGIGKLAALYLSDKFLLVTKTKSNFGGKKSSWILDVSELDENAKPYLTPQDDEVEKKLHLLSDFSREESGTIIHLEDVDLTGFAENKFHAMKLKLSNLFLYGQLEKEILINITTETSELDEFVPIKKQIAFQNMVCIYNDQNFSFLNGKEFTYTFLSKRKELKIGTQKIELQKFSDIQNLMVSGEKYFEGKKKEYKLTGWVGVHSTIDGEDARQNDPIYYKSPYYSPNQLRVYVRGKLALANMLEHLGITRAFANYIEGEVSFDILDDDDLTDIATAGRQDIDTNDERFILLREILRKIGNALVAKRQLLADNIRDAREREDKRITDVAKVIFTKDFSEELLEGGHSAEEATIITNQALSRIEGNVELKKYYTVFISHARKDRIFSDFVFNFLIRLGFNGNDGDENCEIFYTSKEEGMDTDDLRNFAQKIKEFIIAKNNDVLFLTSANFRESENCLFEGGAVWATKTVEQYKILALDRYENIPEYLTERKYEFVFDGRQIANYRLNRKSYINIIKMLNRLIMHLNKNNQVLGRPDVPLLNEPTIPTDYDLAQLGTSIEDYFDLNIAGLWKFYVESKAQEYVNALNRPRYTIRGRRNKISKFRALKKILFVR